MSIVSIGSTLRFASIKLINQNECKITMNLMKARKMSSAAVYNNKNYNGNCYNNGVSTYRFFLLLVVFCGVVQ